MTGTARSGTRRPSASLDGRPGLAGMCWQRLVIELKQFFREREAVVFIFAFPVVMLVKFAR
jgi:ABC-2 type transport system permease protein